MDSGTAQSKYPLKGTASPMAREFEGLRAQHRDFNHWNRVLGYIVVL